MEMEKKYIKKESLEKLYMKLSGAGRKMFAPVTKDGKFAFAYNPSYQDITYNHIQTTQSLKNTVFPKIEKLFNYTTNKENTSITDIDLSLIPQVVIWGCHPCDAAGFASLKSIFDWDYKDQFFDSRIERIAVIGLSCYQCDENCFCTSVGLNPGATNGSDILLTKVKSGDFIAEIITPKGKEVVEMAKDLFEDYNGDEKLSNLAEVKQLFSHENVTEKLKGLFYSPFWVENSLRCIGCGACAYVCPACACFDIQDENKGKSGTRIRCWDSCGFGLFTIHTSGHNPREVQSQRWRQRIMHKFSYMPDRNESLGCLGCGRCSRACPVDMNIAEQLAAINNG